MSKIGSILSWLVVIALVVSTYQLISERSKRIGLEAETRYLESELFASKRLEFVCDSTMQEIYNRVNVDSILAGARIISVDLKIFYQDSSKVTE